MTQPQPIRILIIDDHPMMRLGISAMISSRTDMIVVGEAGDSIAAEPLFRSAAPDVAIVDLRLPGRSGVEIIRDMKLRYPRCAFLVLTTYEGDEDIFQAVRAGASGYLIKGMSQDNLVKGIQTVHSGRRFIPSEVREKLDGRYPGQELSDREREVLKLLAQGMSNKAIGSELGVTEATVKSHVGMILANLNVQDRTQAVLVAIQRGLVHL
jgi:DNA-binding NarL/FixJ family response regulator